MLGNPLVTVLQGNLETGQASGWNDFIFPSGGFRDKNVPASPPLSSSPWNTSGTHK